MPTTVSSSTPQRAISRDVDQKILKECERADNDYKRAAKNMGKKFTPKDLRKRHQEIQNDDSKKRVKFTLYEDLLIAKYYRQYETDWSKIAQHVPARTNIMIKNRYYAHIRKNNYLYDLQTKVEQIEEQFGTQIENLTPEQVDANASPVEEGDVQESENNEEMNEACMEFNKEHSHEESSTTLNRAESESESSVCTERQKDMLKSEIEKAKEDFKTVYQELRMIKLHLGIYTHWGSRWN